MTLYTPFRRRIVQIGKGTRMIRFILVFLTIVLFLIGGIPLLLIEALIGCFNEPLMRRSSLRIVQWVFRVILWETGAKITVLGRENIPTDRSVLYIANHRSYFDILLGYTNVVGLCGFIAKKEMDRFPLLNNWMRNLYCLFLDRDNLKAGLDTILKAIDYEKQGISIFLCPDGTRNQGTEMLPFKEGGMKIAEKSGCPIVPVAIVGTDDLFENHVPWIRAAQVTIRFGEPIYTDSLERAEKKHLGAKTQAVIAAMLDEMRQTAK